MERRPAPAAALLASGGAETRPPSRQLSQRNHRPAWNISLMPVVSSPVGRTESRTAQSRDLRAESWEGPGCEARPLAARAPPPSGFALAPMQTPGPRPPRILLAGDRPGARPAGGDSTRARELSTWWQQAPPRCHPNRAGRRSQKGPARFALGNHPTIGVGGALVVRIVRRGGTADPKVTVHGSYTDAAGTSLRF